MAYRLQDTNPAYWFEYTITVLILFTSSFRASLICYWEVSYLLGQIWGCGIYYYYILLFCLPLNLSSSLLLFLQCLFKLVACSYYCSILVRGLSAFISFLLISLFISLLNFSINALFSYPFPLATLQNFYTNFFIILPSYSNLLNSVTFTDSLSLPLNSFFNSNKNYLADPNSTSPIFKSSSIFFFYIQHNLLNLLFHYCSSYSYFQI